MTSTTPVKALADLRLEQAVGGEPVRGAAHTPETAAAWHAQRRGGFTATDARDWGIPEKRARIIAGKRSRRVRDLSHIPVVAHGTHREPFIADWAQDRFGITPCRHVYAAAGQPRHLASPDGITLDPTGELVHHSPAAVICEIKTDPDDLTPGTLDHTRTVVAYDPASAFAARRYLLQIQWQIYVMAASSCLFIWERHTNQTDPSTGHFTPVGEPEWCFIPRDDEIIAQLLDTTASASHELGWALAN